MTHDHLFPTPCPHVCLSLIGVELPHDHVDCRTRCVGTIRIVYYTMRGCRVTVIVDQRLALIMRVCAN